MTYLGWKFYICTSHHSSSGPWMKLRLIQYKKAYTPLHSYIFLTFFFFLVERYQKTRVSHLQLIAFLPFHQEFKICCTDSFHVVTWGKKQFSLQLVKSDSGPQSALCYPTPCPWAQLLWLNQARAKMCKVAGKKGEGQEPLPHLSALQEQSFCGYT